MFLDNYLVMGKLKEYPETNPKVKQKKNEETCIDRQAIISNRP